MVLAMQVKHGLRKDEMTYLATLIEMKQDKYVEVSDAVAGLLREFTDVMPLELPKTFPPWRAVDHRIELVPRSKPPSKAPYKMSPTELAEMRKQLTELLDVGYIQPSKASYGVLVLF